MSPTSIRFVPNAAMDQSSARRIDLPFTSSEWTFFATVVVLNLALDATLMWIQQWLLRDVRGGLAVVGLGTGLAARAFGYRLRKCA